MFLLLLGKQHKVRPLDMMSLITSSDLDIILNKLHLDDVPGADFENPLYAFGRSGKRW